MGLLLWIPGASASGAGEGLGIGVALGSPIGLTVSPQLTSALSLDLLAGEDFYRGWSSSQVMFSADLDVIVWEIARSNPVRAYLYVGGGVDAWVWGGRSVEMGAEIPVGVSVNLQKLPLQGYVEVVPEWVFVSYMGPQVGASFGARWWFELH